MVFSVFAMYITYRQCKSFEENPPGEGKQNAMKRGLQPVKSIFVVFIAVFAFDVLSAPQSSYLNLPADTLKKWMTTGATFDFLLIDVLNVGEMVGSTKDSVIAAENCRPYKLPWNPGDSSSIFRKTMNKLPKDTAIIIYCHSGNRSKQAAQALSTAGFHTVYSLNNGISSWTGPVMPASSIKPISELPNPSMLKKADVGIKIAGKGRQPTDARKKSLKIQAAGSCLMINHRLRVFNLQGKCLVKKQNPISGRNDNTIPGLSDGPYIIVSDDVPDAVKAGIVQ